MLDVQLIPLHQVAQQYRDYSDSGVDVRADFISLYWNGYKNTVPYHIGSNFSLLFTMPGGNIVKSYIYIHTHYWDISYLAKDDKSVIWHKDTINNQNYPTDDNDQIKSVNQNDHERSKQNYSPVQIVIT